MAVLGISGYASVMYTVTAVTAVSIADMGFTEREIQESDTIHISHIGIDDSAPTLYYWYTARIIEGQISEIKLPLNEAADGGPAGHPIYPGGERMVRSVRNIRNFRIIAGSGSARIAVTIGTYGRGPINTS